jgi:hypothetical protein
MKLASLRYQGEEKAGVLVPGGILPLELLNRKLDWEYPHDLLRLIETGSLETIRGWYQAEGEKELPDLRDLLIPEKELRNPDEPGQGPKKSLNVSTPAKGFSPA